MPSRLRPAHEDRIAPKRGHRHEKLHHCLLRLVIDTNNCAWLPGLVKGLKMLPLHGFGSEHVAPVR
jgi:hypothetical protein